MAAPHATALRPAPLPASSYRLMNPQPAEPAADPRPTAVVLDEQALGRLRELDPDGSHGVLARVLAAFDTSLARLLGQLALARDADDARAVIGVAHTLKSSSASVGAMSLASACVEVERRWRDAPEGAPIGLAQDVARLIREGEAALAAVRAMLRA